MRIINPAISDADLLTLLRQADASKQFDALQLVLHEAIKLAMTRLAVTVEHPRVSSEWRNADSGELISVTFHWRNRTFYDCKPR